MVLPFRRQPSRIPVAKETYTTRKPGITALLLPPWAQLHRLFQRESQRINQNHGHCCMSTHQGSRPWYPVLHHVRIIYVFICLLFYEICYHLSHLTSKFQLPAEDSFSQLAVILSGNIGKLNEERTTKNRDRCKYSHLGRFSGRACGTSF